MHPTHPPQGLELLIRRRGSGDFELRILDAGQTHLGLKPRRAAGVVVEENVVDEATAPVIYLRNATTDTTMRISVGEYLLWSHIDGQNTVQDLAAAYFRTFGSFEFGEIRTFLDKARRLGIIEWVGAPMLRSRAPREIPARVWRRWDNVSPVFDRLLAHLTPALTRPLILCYGAVGAVGAWAYAMGRLDHLKLGALPYAAYLPLFALLLVVSMAAHELAHGLACHAAGRRVKGVGLALHEPFFPGFFVDVTEMWMEPRRARFAVSLVGPATNLFLGGLAALLAWCVGDPASRWLFVAAADANFALAAFTLWPLGGVRCDGYDVFAEALGLPGLRERALQWLRPGATAPSRPARLRFLAYLWGVALTWSVTAVLIAMALHA